MIVAAFVCALAGGCVPVEGGAVEFSWSLRDFDDKKVECLAARISDVRICWEPTDSAGEVGAECRRFDSFPCGASRGVSVFEVETGETAFFVQPRCEGGTQGLAPTGPYRVPPPIVRDVEVGKVVTLNQILVLVSQTSCVGDLCTCAP